MEMQENAKNANPVKMSGIANPETTDPPGTYKSVVWEYSGYPAESRYEPNREFHLLI